MTDQEIIDLAEKSGMTGLSLVDIGFLARFAALVVQHEREACAAVCDAHHDRWDAPGLFESAIAAEDCAAAIRARSNKDNQP